MTKSLSIAIQMDHLSDIDVAGDTTFACGITAQKRGHHLYHYHVNDLSYDGGNIMAWVAKVTFHETAPHFKVTQRTRINLETMDVVFMRQDPPFDMAYITATHLLERLHPKPLVVNHPVHVRNAPEKILFLDFPDLIPPTMISRSVSDIKAFRKEHKDIIIKPLYGNGGVGVFHIPPQDTNLSSILEMFFMQSREPIMAQAYIPEINQGDKRILLIDGEPVGAINRLPAKGESRANMHVGGKAAPSELSPRDREICARLSPVLKERDLILTGIDVIGDYLTEINVTSPTGVQELKRFSNIDATEPFWDAVEKRIT